MYFLDAVELEYSNSLPHDESSCPMLSYFNFESGFSMVLCSRFFEDHKFWGPQRGLNSEPLRNKVFT